MAADIGASLLCDGTREGLLTALFDAEAQKPKAARILMEPPEQLAFDVPLRVYTDENKADRVWRAIQEKLPEEALYSFDMLYICNSPERGTMLMRYLRKGWRLGMRVEDAVNDTDVFAVMQMRKRVGYEIHKLKGLVRFARIQGDIYYCAIEPDHDIVEYLADHFAERLADQRFILHDVHRKKAALYRPEGKGYAVMPMALPADDPTLEDVEFIRLWGAYFKTIAIQERVNPRLQRQHMPVRYWKHLHEMLDI